MALAQQITPAEAAAELLARRHARSNLLDFTRYTFPQFHVNWHHKLICEYLDLWARHEIKRLIINMPPRHGKSELVSRRLPAFIFGRYPDAHVMALSYGADLSQRMNRDTQRIIDSPEYKRLFPDTNLWSKNIRTIADGSYLRNADMFEIVNHKGSYRSAGVGGAIVGMGFTHGIIDDPTKGRAEANSKTFSKNIWDWYTGVFYTRQHPGASILINMTRWVGHDLTGRVLELQDQGGEEWVVLNLPAIAEEPLHPRDPRQVGEALWADRYGLDFLEKVKSNNTYEFYAQYQGKPPSQSGGLFDATKIDTIDYTPQCIKVVRFYDLAVTASKHSDYTAGVKMGLTTDNDIIILDLYHVQREMPEIERGITQNAQLDGRDCAIRLEAEKSGIVGLQYLLRKPELNGYTIDAKPPIGDKFTRATPFASRVNAGKVKMVKASWNRTFLDELALFPGPKDDIVDGSSGAYDMLSERREVKIMDNPFYS